MGSGEDLDLQARSDAREKTFTCRKRRLLGYGRTHPIDSVEVAKRFMLRCPEVRFGTDRPHDDPAGRLLDYYQRTFVNFAPDKTTEDAENTPLSIDMLQSHDGPELDSIVGDFEEDFDDEPTEEDDEAKLLRDLDPEGEFFNRGELRDYMVGHSKVDFESEYDPESGPIEGTQAEPLDMDTNNEDVDSLGSDKKDTNEEMVGHNNEGSNQSGN